jgi:hypothetical protein
MFLKHVSCTHARFAANSRLLGAPVCVTCTHQVTGATSPLGRRLVGGLGVQGARLVLLGHPQDKPGMEQVRCRGCTQSLEVLCCQS